MMKISTNWLNDYIDISDENLQELADKITNAGVNVETIEKHDDPNLVVGQILEFKDHPDSDHLHVCKVDVKKEKLQIVCGASNLEKNMKVIVAKIGAVLPGDIEIKKTTMRGVESCGMLCALSELGLEEDNEENHKKGIHKLPDDALVGTNPYNYLGLDDTIFNLDLNPNREADCTNHIGFAYEVSSVIGKKVELPEIKHKADKTSILTEMEVDVITDNCYMYNAKKACNVVIKESPDFIKQRLINCGMRPINNVVDISNYIMLEYGQPLHFFDAKKLGKSILVRMAENGEKITTLDNVERKLTEDDIVITDGEKPVCIAGIMGGINSGIDNKTKDVIIESAIFDPLKIRYTSIRLGLTSEASRRYEHGLNYEYTLLAIERACYLLEKYADATILDETITYDNIDKTPKVATVTLTKANKLLGLEMTLDDVKKSLNNLHFDYELKGEEFTVTIPNRRNDVSMTEDLIEEIGRLYGYDKIVGKMPKLDVRKGSYKGNTAIRKAISKRLRTMGLNEVKTYTLISSEMSEKFTYNQTKPIELLKPMSNDKSIIRQSILSSLVNVYEFNAARGIKDVNIYEISNTYSDFENENTKIAILMTGNYIKNEWQNLYLKSDFYVLKGIIENLLDYLGYQGRYVFASTIIPDMHPGACASISIDGKEIGYLGLAHVNISKEKLYVCEMSQTNMIERKTRPLKFKEQNKYPQIIKDVAFVMKDYLENDTIIKEIKRYGGKLLKEVNVFDLYKGDNVKDDEKSIAYSLVFEDDTRTLTSEEVNALFNKIIDEVCKKLNLEIRK